MCLYVFVLASDGSESVNLTERVRQSGCVQACQGFTVGVHRWHLYRHCSAHHYHSTGGAFYQQVHA